MTSIFERLLNQNAQADAAAVLTGKDGKKIVAAFHEHLDVCKQCREHPFDLCPMGFNLLKDAAGFKDGVS